ncbi:MAG: MarR family transcriptional regulator, partial [Acetobacteraceae bacterium]|nr:MarR family transcriptional regulator [Acetobacteraceae bacterium]
CRSFGFRLWHLKHAWSRRLEAALAPLGLTYLQFVMLRAADRLARHGERPSQARLAEVLATDRMLVSKVLRLLTQKGLIVRPVHPEDARAVEIVITEAGRQVLRAARPIAQAAQDEFFGRLGPERLNEFDKMLDELLAADGCPLFAAPIVTVTTEDAA